MRPRLRLAALALAVGVVALVVLWRVPHSAHDLRETVKGLGAAGPVIFIAISASLSCAFFPAPLLAGASGLAFGTALGTPISIISAVCAAALAFTISRHAGREAVEHLSGERLEPWQQRLERRGFVAILYARLAPGMPFTLVNYAAGLTRIRLIVFLAATAIGAAPRAFAYTALGGHFGDFSQPETIVAGAILVAMGLAGGALMVRDIRRARSS